MSNRNTVAVQSQGARKVAYIYPVLDGVKGDIILDSLISSRDYVVCRKVGKSRVVVELETDSIDKAREYCEQVGNYACYIVYMNRAIRFANKVRSEHTTLSLYYNGAIYPLAELSIGEGVELKSESRKVLVFHGTSSNKLNTTRIV